MTPEGGAEIRDVARLVDRDDLLLFLEKGRALQVATGAHRGRVCSTRRRFRKEQFQTGPLVDRLRRLLVGARIVAFEEAAGERRFTILVRTDSSENCLRLEVELFGNRGLWCLTDGEGRILEMSRLPKAGRGQRLLRPGGPYQVPARGGSAEHHETGPQRFGTPCLRAVDEHFTALDLSEENQRLRRQLSRTVEARRRLLRGRMAGLAEQQRRAEQAPELRLRGDMLLAYGFAADRDADALTVPHPHDPDRQWTIPLVPREPIQQQADRLYRRARKLEDAVLHGQQRKAAAAQELADLDAIARMLDAGHRERGPGDCQRDHDDLINAKEQLQGRGLLPRPPGKPTAARSRLKKALRGENLRVFTSVEGYAILVGRDNRQNDRLSTAIARGNDLWFHVGSGHAGSHVVVRVPKGKTASLETLLDAGTLTVHFSKARGTKRCEVTYTHAKNVRKPKGLPPGRVTVARARTLVVDADPARLRRLLDSLQSEQAE